MVKAGYSDAYLNIRGVRTRHKPTRCYEPTLLGTRRIAPHLPSGTSTPTGSRVHRTGGMDTRQRSLAPPSPIRGCESATRRPQRRSGLSTGAPPTGSDSSALCLFVGDSEDPTPVTIINGQLTCEPHNGYFQGGNHVQAIITWKREHAALGNSE